MVLSGINGEGTLQQQYLAEDAIDHKIHNPPHFNTTYISLTPAEADLFYLKQQLKRAPNGTEDQVKAQKALDAEIAKRKREDHNILLIWNRLFGKDTTFDMLAPPIRPRTIDEYNCYFMLRKNYNHHCGVLSIYGSKYGRTFANICGAGFSMEHMIEAISHTCPLKN
ncbi:unnamed protein product [Trifolium pratense]|uniref:Uncharacterized protein n=1 Tax=Trifolium pratense TaxID=57577 RepID=A0ACB0IZ13_TRIPR|nr:unnamed protein product [Trifolium pratense]